MKKLLFGAFVLAMIASLGCAITNYPVLLDSRGDYSGVIRTGHKAYITPTGDIALIYADGSDNLFSMVYQNNYGDQKLYTFNNFDPSASVLFLDQTYCDWRYNGCEIWRAWNPHQSNVDNVFDGEYFPNCSGARSLSSLISYSSRMKECGDRVFTHDLQGMYGNFANLATTTWRGQTAYIVPIDNSNTSMTLTSNGGLTTAIPLYSAKTAIITDRLQMVYPVNPNDRMNLRWLQSWINDNGSQAVLNVTYGGVNGSARVGFKQGGIVHNLNRF
jgi:hypothetical protein